MLNSMIYINAVHFKTKLTFKELKSLKYSKIDLFEFKTTKNWQYIVIKITPNYEVLYIKIMN